MPAFGIVAFCDEELNPLGPVHVYEAPLIAFAVRDMELPTHKAPLLEARGATGRGLTTAIVDEGKLAQPFTVEVT